MPLNPSSYSKIFKSKYVQDDEEEPSTPEARNDDTPSYTPSVPTYSTPKVQELLNKPKLNFDRIFSSRYVDGGSVLPSFNGSSTSKYAPSSEASSYKPTETYKSYQPARAVSEAPSSSKYSTNKDYDKIFTSKYLDEKPTFQKGVNPYIVEENSDDEAPVRHLPPSRSSSIRRATSLRRTYDESAPFTKNYEPRPLKNLVYSRSTTPQLRAETPSLSYRSTRSTTPAPRRIYPQTSSSYDYEDLRDKDEAPIVLDANLTFVLGCKAPLKQYVKPIPAHQESDTQSSALSSKISDFLQRTDHVMQEWQNVGPKRKKREDTNLTGKSRSATNIMIKGFQLYSKANSVGRSSAGNSLCDDDTQDDVDELSEMTADLAEEHSTSTLAAERLDAETAERLRLERELTDMQQRNKSLQNNSEKLEMELLYARSDLTSMSEDEDDMDNEPVYKQRYERVLRELEFTKRRLQQQHEDDLEQLVGLKKQLEKKLTDAYEEVEEQRQVVGQWKRKVQKLTGEMGDIKLLLEEQTSRNNMLEKKQRKFDSELQAMQEDMKKEKLSKERFGREKEVLTAEKFTLESTIADLRMELEMKDEKLHSLQRELDELTFGGKTEEEVTILRKQKIDCERRLHDQDEELDELAGQVQLLEQAKLKLEMSLEQQRKTSKKEAQQHEEELEEVRCNAQKKVKALEAQLEAEHEERTVLLREKHEFERRLATALDNDRNDKAVDEAVVQRLKRDLKRTKALLRDTQMQLERQKTENPSKAVIRQLRNQIDDLELARAAAVKSKQLIESELSETQSQLDEITRQKNEFEEKLNVTNRERADLQNQVEENEEELAEVLKKYKTTIQQMSLDQIALQEQVALVGELEAERSSLKEQLAEMSSRLETVENMGDASSNMLVRRGELKVKELENKLELEQTTRQRLDVQIARLKEAVEKLQHDLSLSRNKEQQAQDQIRKLQRNLRELKDEHNSAMTKEGESILKRKDLEKKYEALEAETSTVRTDLRLALKRIEDLQAVIQNDLEDSSSDSEEQDSYSSDDSVNSFLKNHRLSGKPSIMQIDQKPRSNSASNISKDNTSYA